MATASAGLCDALFDSIVVWSGVARWWWLIVCLDCSYSTGTAWVFRHLFHTWWDICITARQHCGLTFFSHTKLVHHILVNIQYASVYIDPYVPNQPNNDSKINDVGPLDEVWWAGETIHTIRHTQTLSSHSVVSDWFGGTRSESESARCNAVRFVFSLIGLNFERTISRRHRSYIWGNFDTMSDNTIWLSLPTN